MKQPKNIKIERSAISTAEHATLITTTAAVRRRFNKAVPNSGWSNVNGVIVTTPGADELYKVDESLIPRAFRR